MNFEVTEDPGEEWDRFAENQTDVLFYYSVWGEVLKVGLGGRPYYFYQKNADGIVCGMPGVILTYYGIRLFYSSIPYGGFIGERSLFESFMNRVVEETKNADIAYFAPFSADDDEGYGSRFTATAEVATRIDLTGRNLAEMPSCWEASVRQSLNKAVRLGVEVERCDDRESFLTAHRLYLQTMERNGAIARYPEKWFGALHQILAGGGRVCVYMARHNGIPVSATVVVNSKAGYHLLHSGSSTEHLRLRANDVIVCEIIKAGIREGKEYIDLMFSDPSDTKLIRWKEKFGGSTVMLHKFRRINSPFKNVLWDSAKKIYPLLHRFRKNGRTGQP